MSLLSASVTAPTSSQGATAEEQPADEQPADDQPEKAPTSSQGATAEEQPADEQPADDQPEKAPTSSQGATAEEQPADEQPADDQPEKAPTSSQGATAEEQPADDQPEKAPTSEVFYDAAGEPSEVVKAATKAGNLLFDTEWEIWRADRMHIQTVQLDNWAKALNWTKHARAIFSLRYRNDSRLTRWYADTRLADYEMFEREKHLHNRLRRSYNPAVTMPAPLDKLYCAAAAIGALLLLALVGVVVFALLGCSTDADADATGATASVTSMSRASTQTSTATTNAVTTTVTPDPRACSPDRFQVIEAWQNCSNACKDKDYPDAGENATKTVQDCTRALWKVCYGPEACWDKPTQAPIAKLKCAQNAVRYSALEATALTQLECPADTTYCHVYAASGSLFFGCYGDKQIKPANKDVGCGKSIPNGQCRLVAAKVPVTGGKYAGAVELCCCYGAACNTNKTLAQLAVNKAEAAQTCVESSKYSRKGKRGEVEFDGEGSSQDTCKAGPFCYDYLEWDSDGSLTHVRGCDGPADFAYNCLAKLDGGKRTCFNFTSTKKKFGVCCCLGDNCAADDPLNSTTATTAAPPVTSGPCDFEYELVDGAPNAAVDGAEVERGCAAVTARVLPAADLCKWSGDGCFETHDVDLKAVSLCCCPGAGCTPKDVLEYVANKKTTPRPTTTTSSTTTTAASTASTGAGNETASTASTGAGNETATATSTGEAPTTTGVADEAPTTTTGAGDEAAAMCWKHWAAVGCGVLFAALLVPLAPTVYLLQQFKQSREMARWVWLQGKIKGVVWAAYETDFSDEMWRCVDGMEGVHKPK